MSFGSFVKDAGKAVVKGASQGGGLISTPFKAVRAGANSIGGIKKNITSYYNPKKKQKAKSRFRKKSDVIDKPYITPPPLPKM